MRRVEEGRLRRVDRRRCVSASPDESCGGHAVAAKLAALVRRSEAALLWRKGVASLLGIATRGIAVDRRVVVVERAAHRCPAFRIANPALREERRARRLSAALAECAVTALVLG